jgi:hypothetical protein
MTRMAPRRSLAWRQAAGPAAALEQVETRSSPAWLRDFKARVPGPGHTVQPRSSEPKLLATPQGRRRGDLKSPSPCPLGYDIPMRAETG